MERGHGHFHRRFVLLDTVDSEKVNASGSHGVLTVTIPKQAKAMPPPNSDWELSPQCPGPSSKNRRARARHIS